MHGCMDCSFATMFFFLAARCSFFPDASLGLSTCCIVQAMLPPGATPTPPPPPNRANGKPLPVGCNTRLLTYESQGIMSCTMLKYNSKIPIASQIQICQRAIKSFHQVGRPSLPMNSLPGAQPCVVLSFPQTDRPILRILQARRLGDSTIALMECVGR